MNIQTKKKVNKAFLYAVQIFVAVVFVIPLVWMIVSSLKREVDIFKDMNSLATLMLNNPTLENYKEMFARSEIVNSMLNSTFYIAMILIIGIPVNALAGYSLAKLMVGLFTNWQEVLSASNVKMANVAYIVFKKL